MFSDSAAEQHLAALLIKRRDKILRAYLPAVNPIVNPSLGADGLLRFENAAVAAGVASPAVGYRVSWARFDNGTGETRPLGDTLVSTTSTLPTPPELPSADGVIIRADVSATAADPAAWQRPVHIYFRRAGATWALIGLDRGIGNHAPASRPPAK
jgi:hypothetical protein